MKAIAFALSLLTMSALAEDTNRVPVISTNYVQSVPWYRDVNGQLYNTEKSSKFAQITGAVNETGPGYITLDWRKKEEGITQFGTVDHGVFDKKIMVVNCYYTNLVERQLISITAMRTGKTNIDGEVLEVFDCGTPHCVPVTITNWLKK